MFTYDSLASKHFHGCYFNLDLLHGLIDFVAPTWYTVSIAAVEKSPVWAMKWCVHLVFTKYFRILFCFEMCTLHCCYIVHFLIYGNSLFTCNMATTALSQMNCIVPISKLHAFSFWIHRFFSSLIVDASVNAATLQIAQYLYHSFTSALSRSFPPISLYLFFIHCVAFLSVNSMEVNWLYCQQITAIVWTSNLFGIVSIAPEVKAHNKHKLCMLPIWCHPKSHSLLSTRIPNVEVMFLFFFSPRKAIVCYNDWNVGVHVRRVRDIRRN